MIFPGRVRVLAESIGDDDPDTTILVWEVINVGRHGAKHTWFVRGLFRGFFKVCPDVTVGAAVAVYRQRRLRRRVGPVPRRLHMSTMLR